MLLHDAWCATAGVAFTVVEVDASTRAVEVNVAKEGGLCRHSLEPPIDEGWAECDGED